MDFWEAFDIDHRVQDKLEEDLFKEDEEMTFQEIAEKAYRGVPITEHKLNLAEKYAYLQLYYLYREFKKMLITEKNAKEEKIKIEKEYNANQKKIDDYYEGLKERNKFRNHYENFIIDIEKAKDEAEILDKSLRFIEEVIKDNSFYDRQMKKIDNKDNI